MMVYSTQAMNKTVKASRFSHLKEQASCDVRCPACGEIVDLLFNSTDDLASLCDEETAEQKERITCPSCGSTYEALFTWKASTTYDIDSVEVSLIEKHLDNAERLNRLEYESREPNLFSGAPK